MGPSQWANMASTESSAGLSARVEDVSRTVFAQLVMKGKRLTLARGSCGLQSNGNQINQEGGGEEGKLEALLRARFYPTASAVM